MIQGIEEYGEYTDVNGEPCLFDADDLDNGLDGTGAPSDGPLRLTVETDAGVSALRLPYTSTRGSHGFGFAQPSQPGDQNSLALNQIAYYFMTGERCRMISVWRTFPVIGFLDGCDEARNR